MGITLTVFPQARNGEESMTTTDQPTTALPFGKHKHRPLPDVPSAYLSWLLATVKLSARLRSAVAGELRARGGLAPAPPTPEPEPVRCHRCGGTELRLRWRGFRDGRRMIARRCPHCRTHLGFAPQTPGNVALADAAEGGQDR